MNATVLSERLCESALSTAATDAATLKPTPGPCVAALPFPTALLPTTPPHAVGTSAGACATSAPAAFIPSSCDGVEIIAETHGLRPQLGFHNGGPVGVASHSHDLMNAILHKRSLPYSQINTRRFTPDAKFWRELERAIGAA